MLVYPGHLKFCLQDLFRLLSAHFKILKYKHLFKSTQFIRNLLTHLFPFLQAFILKNLRATGKLEE